MGPVPRCSSLRNDLWMHHFLVRFVWKQCHTWSLGIHFLCHKSIVRRSCIRIVTLALISCDRWSSTNIMHKNWERTEVDVLFPVHYVVVPEKIQYRFKVKSDLNIIVVIFHWRTFTFVICNSYLQYLVIIGGNKLFVISLFMERDIYFTICRYSLHV